MKDTRHWWQKKRWWVGALPIVWAVYFFTPYSINGPAANCVIAGHERNFERNVLSYSERNEWDQIKTLRYVENSGYRLRNISRYDNEIVSVFTIESGFFPCFPLNIFNIDGLITRIHLSAGEDKKMIVVGAN